MLRPQLANAELWTVDGGSVEDASALSKRLREGFYDAVVGIGGGRTLDVAKLAATLAGLPIVAVATSLAHDGIASPVASLYEHGRKSSYGVQMPIAVVVDLDYVQRSEPVLRRSGIGDVDLATSSAIEDWRLAGRERDEPVDGVAVTFARTAATSILHRRDGIDDEAFLVALAEALVLSGLAMATAGSSRPCSGSEHEVLHAIDHLFPETARHGELAGAACLFTSFLRGDEVAVAAIDGCLRRHGLPRTPARPRADGRAVHRGRRARARARGRTASRSSSTSTSTPRRPARASAPTSMPSIAELRAATQPPSLFARNSGEHWAGRLYVRRFSPYLTRLVIPTRLTPNAVTYGMIAGRRAGGGRAVACRACGRRSAAVLLIQAADPARLLRRRARALAPAVLAGRDLPRPASRHYVTETLFPIALGIRADGGWDEAGGTYTCSA